MKCSSLAPAKHHPKNFLSLLCFAAVILGATNSMGGAPTPFEVVKLLGKPSNGSNPYSPLVAGSDGWLYGVNAYEGQFRVGTIIRMNEDGKDVTVLKHLKGDVTGGYPFGGLLLGADGALYGTATGGGNFDGGTIFKMNVDGTGFTVLQHLQTAITGSRPFAALIQGADGTLYGTNSGAEDTTGNVFKLNPDGTGFTVLWTFNESTDGRSPETPVCLGSDGYLYGTTAVGGVNNRGTVFKLSTDGTEFSVVKQFDTASGGAARCGLVKVPDGTLYGTTSGKGGDDYGTVFKLAPDGGDFTVVERFAIASTGAYPLANLVLGVDGWLHGVTARGGVTYVPGDGGKGKDDGGFFGYGTQFKFMADGTGFTVVKSFTADQGFFVGLNQGGGGSVYATTANGGAYGGGSVVNLGDQAAVLYSFTSRPDGSEGRSALGGLVQGPDGFLYGTAAQGGADDLGAIFKMRPSGDDFAVVKSFAPGDEAVSPDAGLTLSPDGVLYGTTYNGGINDGGTIFKINVDGTGFAVITHFDGSTGKNPIFGRLLIGADGALYGATRYEGQSGSGNGTVFKVNTDGTGFVVLKRMESQTGSVPGDTLVQGTDGTLYGTASEGGDNGNGTIFRLNPDGSNFTVLRHASGEGGVWHGGLTLGTDGKLYGSALNGGSFGPGTIYSINVDGSGFTVLKNLDATTGSGFLGGMVQAKDGKLYGATIRGGADDLGTLIRLNPDGTAFEVLHQFEEGTGKNVYGALIEAADGYMYGAAAEGGYGAGSLFRLRMSIVPVPSILVEQPAGSRLYSGDSREFAPLALGESALMLFTVTNNGHADLTNVQAQISGMQAGEFVLASSPQATVASPLGSTTFSVRFTPQAPGLRSTTLRILSNDSLQSPFDITLTGTATGPEQGSPVINVTAPAQNALTKLAVFTVKGVVKDAKGIATVTVALNGGAAVPAVFKADKSSNRQSLRSPPRPSGDHVFSLDVTLVPGKNTLAVRATNTDGSSTTVTRTFFHDTRRPLTITRGIPKGLVRHDKICVVSLAADPVKAASAPQPNELPFSSTSDVVIGASVTLTATTSAKSGYVFREWNGLPAGATLAGNVASFIMPDAAVSETRAEFMHSPFYPRDDNAYTFSGLIHPTGDTPSSNATQGFISGTLNALTGAFTGTVLIDGISLPIAAAFFGDGSCVFSVGSAKLPALSFSNKSLVMSYDEGEDVITATITQGASTSQGRAMRGTYTSTNPVPADLLDPSSNKGTYTLAIERPDASNLYPRGYGYATLSVSNLGIVMLTGVLADGTPITASSCIVEGDNCPFFVQYGTPGASAKTKGSSFSGTLSFNGDSGVTGSNMLWFRAAAEGDVPLYTEGWPAGIAVDAFGALFSKTLKVETALGLMDSDSESLTGNALLDFTGGKLPDGEITKNNFNIRGNGVIKLAPADASYTLALTATGTFKGTFDTIFTSHPHIAKPAYKGIVIQKGKGRGGYGFFISNAKDDSEPEAGAVTLRASRTLEGL